MIMPLLQNAKNGRFYVSTLLLLLLVLLRFDQVTSIKENKLFDLQFETIIPDLSELPYPYLPLTGTTLDGGWDWKIECPQENPGECDIDFSSYGRLLFNNRNRIVGGKFTIGPIDASTCVAFRFVSDGISAIAPTDGSKPTVIPTVTSLQTEFQIQAQRVMSLTYTCGIDASSNRLGNDTMIEFAFVPSDLGSSSLSIESLGMLCVVDDEENLPLLESIPCTNDNNPSTDPCTIDNNPSTPDPAPAPTSSAPSTSALSTPAPSTPVPSTPVPAPSTPVPAPSTPSLSTPNPALSTPAPLPPSSPSTDTTIPAPTIIPMPSTDPPASSLAASSTSSSPTRPLMLLLFFSIAIGLSGVFLAHW